MVVAGSCAFFVIPPAVAQLVLLTSSATSGVPSVLRPACAAAAVKPRGDVMEPFGISGIAEDIGGVESPRFMQVPPPRGFQERTILPHGPYDLCFHPVLLLLRNNRVTFIQRM